jgi:acyl-CoA thioester hydrolase
MTMTTTPRYSMTIQVLEADIDQLQHVNNIAFLRFVQDIAVAHWRAIAPVAVQEAVAWVVRKHEIEYFRPAFLGDELSVLTWVDEPSAATWDRFTEITRVSDGQTIVKARTVWVLIDPKTGRPRRVDARITGTFLDPAPKTDDSAT